MATWGMDMDSTRQDTAKGVEKRVIVTVYAKTKGQIETCLSFSWVPISLCQTASDMPPESDPYRHALQRLEDLQRAGVTHIPACSIPARKTAPSNTPVSSPPRTGSADRTAAKVTQSGASRRAGNSQAISNSETDSPPAAPKPAPPANPIIRNTKVSDSTPLHQLENHSDERRAELLQLLTNEVRSCESCAELVANRTQTVFGVGNQRPRLCFFGEGPGADEDRKGEPFVGRAGQLLNKIIAAMTLAREDVYILNAVKCRPPQNRNPKPDELDCCRSYWERQLEILQPEYVCCLGGIAANTLFDTQLSVGKMRGKWHEYRGAQVIVTYHPAYLLRNEFAKRYVWDDIKKLMEAMGLKRA